MYDAAGMQWHAASRFMPSAQAPAYMLMHGHSSINAGKISSSGQERKYHGRRTAFRNLHGRQPHGQHFSGAPVPWIRPAMIVPINPDEHGPSGTNHLAVLFDLHVYQCSFQRGASNLQGDGRKPFPARNRVHEWGRKRTLSAFFQRITIIGDGFDIRNPFSMNILFPVRPEPGKQVFHGIIQKRRFPVPQRKPHPFEKQLFIITITAQEPIGSQNGHASVDEDGVLPVPSIAQPCFLHLAGSVANHIEAQRTPRIYPSRISFCRASTMHSASEKNFPPFSNP